MRRFYTYFPVLTKILFVITFFLPASMAAQKTGRVYFMGISVDDYKSPKLPGKPNAAKDVNYIYTDLNRDVMSMVSQENPFHFSANDGNDVEYTEVRQCTLADQKAKIFSIDSAFTEIAKKATAYDIFILYFNVVSDATTGDLFLPSKTKGSIDTLRPQRLSELISRVNCQKQLLIFDDAGLSLLKSQLMDMLCPSVTSTKYQVVIVPTKNDTINRSDYAGGKLCYVLIQSKTCLLNVFKSTDENIPEIESKLNNVAWKFDQGQGGRYVKMYASSVAVKTVIVQNPNAPPKPEPPPATIKTSVEESEELFADIKNYALVIGVNDYQSNAWPDLKNPIKDATALAAELADWYSFDTATLINPTRSQILQALNNLQKRNFGENSQVLIFFAGHGATNAIVGGFLVPSDGKEMALDTNGDSYIKYTDLHSRLDKIKATHKLLIVDACNSGSLFEITGIDDHAISSRSAQGPSEDELHMMQQVKESMSGKFFAGITSTSSSGKANDKSQMMERLMQLLKAYHGKKSIITWSMLNAEIEKAGSKKLVFYQQNADAEFIFIPRKK